MKDEIVLVKTKSNEKTQRIICEKCIINYCLDFLSNYCIDCKAGYNYQIKKESE